MRSPYRIAAMLVAALAGIATAVLVSRHSLRDATAPPEIGGYVLPEPRALGDIALVDERGAAFTSRDFAGAWSFLYFGYTYCPDICPLTLVELAAVKHLLAESAPDARAVFYLVSVDPARDTPSRLGEYVAYFDPAFRGLTGSSEALTALANRVGAVFFVPDGQDTDTYLVSHSSSIVLLDPEGRHAAVLTAPHEPARIAADFAAMREYYARRLPR